MKKAFVLLAVLFCVAAFCAEPIMRVGIFTDTHVTGKKTLLQTP